MNRSDRDAGGLGKLCNSEIGESSGGFELLAMERVGHESMQL